MPGSAMTPDLMVACRDIDASFGGQQVLRGVMLDVAPGDTVGLVGANGAGKTTLLRIIAGLLRARRGSVMVLGRRPEDLGPTQRFALIGQPSHYPWLSVMGNISFVAREAGLDVSATRRVLADLRLDAQRAKRVGLSRAIEFGPGAVVKPAR